AFGLFDRALGVGNGKTPKTLTRSGLATAVERRALGPRAVRAVNREVGVWQRRWRDLGRVHGLAAAALLGSTPLAAAQSETAPGAEAGQDAPREALSIWYRSSEGCRDGAVFVTRLAELGRAATLARVGDRVDFVVTVAAAPDA